MPHSDRTKPLQHYPENKKAAKATHHGHKTAASVTTTTTALLAVPFDPSGIALLTAVGSGSMALGGLAYHSSRKTLKAIEGKFDEARAKKALALAQPLPDSQTLVVSQPQIDNVLAISTSDLQTELESCIRRLSCSVTGVVVSGSMSFILPTFILSGALNSAELLSQARRLHKLIAKAKAEGGVDRYLSSSDVTFQVISGLVIKSAILISTLGADVDVAIQGFAQQLVVAEVALDPALVPDTWQEAGHVRGLYDGLIGHGLLHTTTQIAGAPANITAGLLGYGQVPTWGSGASTADVTKIGAANVLVDLVTGKLVEEPTHELLDFASRLGRRFGRGRN